MPPRSGAASTCLTRRCGRTAGRDRRRPSGRERTPAIGSRLALALRLGADGRRGRVEGALHFCDAHLAGSSAAAWPPSAWARRSSRVVEAEVGDDLLRCSAWLASSSDVEAISSEAEVFCWVTLSSCWIAALIWQRRRSVRGWRWRSPRPARPSSGCRATRRVSISPASCAAFTVSPDRPEIPGLPPGCVRPACALPRPPREAAAMFAGARRFHGRR